MRKAIRIAVLVTGVVLVVLLLPLTYLFYGLSQGMDDESSVQATTIGMIMLVLWLIACAFVLSRPLVSALVFALAGMLGFAMDGGFPIVDPWVGPGISLVLAGLSFLGWGGREERRTLTVERTRQADRR